MEENFKEKYIRYENGQLDLKEVKNHFSNEDPEVVSNIVDCLISDNKLTHENLEVLWNFMSDSLRHNKEVLSMLLKYNTSAFSLFDEEIRTNKDFVIKALKTRKTRLYKIEHYPIYRNLPAFLKNDIDVINAVIENGKEEIFLIKFSQIDDVETAKKLVKVLPRAYCKLNTNLRKNKDLARFLAMNSFEFMFPYVDSELKKDKIFIKELINLNPRIFYQLDKEIACEEDIIELTFDKMFNIKIDDLKKKEAILYMNDTALGVKDVKLEFFNDRNFALAFAKSKRTSLNDILIEKYKDDREIITEAIKNKTYFPLFLTNFKDDKEIALLAVSNSTGYYDQLSESLKLDLDILSRTLETNVRIIRMLQEKINRVLRNNNPYN